MTTEELEEEFSNPIPDFIYRKFPIENYESMIDKFLKNIDFNPENSDLAFKLKAIGSYMVWLNYYQFCHLIKNQYLKYAEGVWLDELADKYGISRSRETPPIAKIRLTSTEPVTLKAGTQFANSDNTLSYLLADVEVTPSGAIATVQTDKEGDKTVVRAINYVAALDKIETLGRFTRLSRGENDEAFRRRIYLSLNRWSTAGSKDTYDYYASSVPGVIQAYSLNNGAGKVLVVYDADDDISDLVKKAVTGINPITDSVTVKKATRVSLDIKLTITYNKDASMEAVESSVLSTVKTAITNLKIGESIPVSKFYSYVTEHPGIYSSELDQETINTAQNVEPHSILKFGNLTFTSRIKDQTNG